MSILRGRADSLSIYGVAGMLFFFIGCGAVVMAAALGVEWLLALWAVAWTASIVMTVVGSVKNVR